ncbi:MAG: hypothetical protein CMJ81_16930 [Planctomycetaceae bacterium]|nr:hypothetical protein [Planctomycetaceae bacterium]MBP63322.1 hypothetical protein [Planctomycetaceae bacterium]
MKHKEIRHLSLRNGAHLQTLDDLRDFIHGTICELNEFEPDVFEMTEVILTRGKRPCGRLFCLHGPRRVRLTAIWETDSNSVLFYDAVGERSRKVRLTNAPHLVSSMVANRGNVF